MKLKEGSDPTARVKAPTAVVKQIDHLLVVTSNPLQLFELFWRVFRLPHIPETATPEQLTTETKTTSGWWTGAGVTLGNIHLWFIRFEEGFEHLWKESKWSPFGTQSEKVARIEGMVLEPYDLPLALRNLGERQIEHGEVVTHRYPHAVEKTADLPGFLDDNVLVSFSRYEYLDGSTRQEIHTRDQQRLDAVGGGILRLQSAARLVLGSPTPAREIGMWNRLLSPLKLEGNEYRFPNGFHLELTHQPRPAVCAIELNCADIKAARHDLEALGMAGPSSDGALQILPDALEGLNVRLIPSPITR